MQVLSRARASGSHHLPWALPRILQVCRKIKRRRRKRLPRRPRMRRCLLKGCEKRFHPRQARQRYCSQECREAARKWARWKAQQRYRATAAGQQKRNGQSRRYRERVRSRKPAETEAVEEAARVIPQNIFFDDSCDRPGCYEDSIEHGEVPCNASVRRRVARAGARPGAGTALETGAHFVPTY